MGEHECGFCQGVGLGIPPDVRCVSCGERDNAVGYLNIDGSFRRQVVAGGGGEAARQLAQRIVNMKNQGQPELAHVAIILNDNQLCQFCQEISNAG